MNRTFNKMLMLLVLCVIGFGFYRGWFALSKSSPDASHKVNINLTLDPDKVKADANTLQEKTSVHTVSDPKETNELGGQVTNVK